MISKDNDHKTITSIYTPVDSFTKVIHKPKGSYLGSVVNHKTHSEYDSIKHVSHNRNHTIPGVGRHS